MELNEHITEANRRLEEADLIMNDDGEKAIFVRLARATLEVQIAQAHATLGQLQATWNAAETVATAIAKIQ